MTYRDMLFKKAQFGFNSFINFIDNDFNLTYSFYHENTDDNTITYNVYYHDNEICNEFIDSYTFDKNGNYKELRKEIKEVY